MTGSPSAYESLGVSATKADVHAALEGSDPGLFPGAFCRIGEDVLGGDPDWCCVAHADDAGTKVLAAYLLYKETGDPTVFRGVAQDALVMNTDDLLCVGAVDRFLLTNTINRNSFFVPGEVVAEIVRGYQDAIGMFAREGIRVVATGGETADMVDAVRTILVGATLTARLPRSQVIDNSRIQAGDRIVGLSSTGQARYEPAPNSGIGDNGLTLARHALLAKEYAEKYPETTAPEVDARLVYRGPFRLSDSPEGLGMTVGEALVSPTRTYAPILRDLVASMRDRIHGIVHNTGGGQTKCRRFGRGVRYVKDDLFPVPALFEQIGRHGGVSWPEMYQTFNMGHRMELYVPPAAADVVIAVSRSYGVDARVVGRCEAAATGGNEVVLQTPHGEFVYS